MQNFGEKTQM